MFLYKMDSLRGIRRFLFFFDLVTSKALSINVLKFLKSIHNVPCKYINPYTHKFFLDSDFFLVKDETLECLPTLHLRQRHVLSQQVALHLPHENLKLIVRVQDNMILIPEPKKLNKTCRLLKGNFTFTEVDILAKLESSSQFQRQITKIG